MVEEVRESVLANHRETVAAVQRCADAVVDSGRANGQAVPHANGRAAVPDGRALAQRLERELADAGVLADFPDLLADAVAAAGYELQATPVAAPPYVAVTSLGPVARATVADGRLVVAVEVFEVERGDQPRYVRRGGSPADALVVEFR